MTFMLAFKKRGWIAVGALLLGAGCASNPAAAPPPIPVKVVVLSMFERGADTGDEAGEFQHWVEREKLDKVLPFPQGFHNIRMNDDGVLGTVTGIGNPRAAATVMALGLDPRFDLTKAYWVVAGIAGVDPLDTTLGAAAWAEYVVDADLAHEIDSREIPKDWKTGYVPLRKSVPFEPPRADQGEVFHLNPGLVEWAFQLTKDVALMDSDKMREEREHFPGANARRAPFVTKGDTISGSTFWHGKLLSDWANGWVSYHTEGKGNYVTTAMEDTGTLQSLTWLARAGKVDVSRVLVLRTGSDFDQPVPGEPAAASLARNKIGKYTGYVPSIENAHRVGSVVVRDLVANWGKYRDQMPGR